MLHQEIEKLKGSVSIKKRYENFIGGRWVAPVGGEYFDSPVILSAASSHELAQSKSLP